jgi:hypothetical protein
MHKERGRGVVHVKDLFAKYAATLKAPQKTVIQAFLNAVHDVCGVTIPSGQCSYAPQTRTLTLTASGILKTEILFKKKEILKAMEVVLGAQNIPRDLL